MSDIKLSQQAQEEYEQAVDKIQLKVIKKLPLMMNVLIGLASNSSKIDPKKISHITSSFDRCIGFLPAFNKNIISEKNLDNIEDIDYEIANILKGKARK